MKLNVSWVANSSSSSHLIGFHTNTPEGIRKEIRAGLQSLVKKGQITPEVLQQVTNTLLFDMQNSAVLAVDGWHGRIIDRNELFQFFYTKQEELLREQFRYEYWKRAISRGEILPRVDGYVSYVERKDVAEQIENLVRSKMSELQPKIAKQVERYGYEYYTIVEYGHDSPIAYQRRETMPCPQEVCSEDIMEQILSIAPLTLAVERHH